MQLLKYIQNRLQSSGFFLIVIAVSVIFFSSDISTAQQRIAHVQPDAIGPGMTIAMEVLAPEKDSGAFGADGIYLPSSKILLINPTDSFQVIFGPVVVSWRGRVLQVPVMAKPDAVAGRQIKFQIITGNKKSAIAAFEIARLQPKISISGDALLGDGFSGVFSFGGNGNTIVADEIEFFGSDFANRGLYTFSTIDTDLSGGNSHYHPVTLLSRGPIHLRNANLSVSGDSLNGGPGGGGGGHGFAGVGGAGYTGGGSDSDYSPLNFGSGDTSTLTFGGASSTGVVGGANSFILQNTDQGGGGGTGCPYGTSGINTGGNDTSNSGGFGGGSAGGEVPGIPYGGGGGAFASDGTAGAGIGNNAGKLYGGRFIVPMQGGSGGGAGNSEGDSTAGSGGGGAGALTLISFDTLSIVSSSVLANGSNGTGGITQTDAGGGGGSGGGLLLSARLGITVNNTDISAKGGSGGLGGTGVEQSAKGGDGGKGRIRIDGEIPLSSPNLFISGVQNFGPTLNIPSIRLSGPFAKVDGIAGDSASLTDSIRIYYRNHHLSWGFFDTVRFKVNGKYHWQAFLPIGHDTSLFVTAMAQVRNPTQSFANFEPQRLLSHLSSGIIKVNATPHLVLQQDTLIFGCYKINDTCVLANFTVENQGEDSLHVTGINIIPTGNFSVSPKSFNLGYYESKNIVIQYCPTKVGKDTVSMQLVSNDSVRVVKLIGCGIDKDTRITLNPTTLDFGKVKVGKCDTLSFTARSIGKDAALFSPDAFSHPPFKIIQPSGNVLLASNDSLHVVISFCPDDTGDFHSSFIVTEKRDSVIVTGIGTRLVRMLKPEKNLQGKDLCVNNCDIITLHLSSTGNDTVTISNIEGASFVSQILPIKIPPQIDTQFIVRYCAVGKGDTSVIIRYTTDSDSLVDSTVLRYHGIRPEFVHDSAVHFSSLCLPGSDSMTFLLHKIGLDTISISSIHLKNGSPFSLSGNTSAKRDSTHFVVHFTPSQSGTFNDTLSLFLNLGVCGDSVLKIPIDGSTVISNVQFSPAKLSFGTVDTGSCKIDSVSITASCAITIQIPSVAAPFSVVSPAGGSISLLSGDTKYIVYQYCPNSISTDSLSQVFNSLPNGSFTLDLLGTGSPALASPFVRFKLENIIVTAGLEFLYLLSVDSISPGTDIRSLQGALHYDPTLLEPISMNGVIWKIFGNAESTPGTYNFSANNKDPLTNGPFATLRMLALYGSRDTTSVFLDQIQLPSNIATSVIPGFIRVIHCGNLPGNIIVAGDYALGNPTPNPGNGNISFPVILGNDGILHVRLFTPSGVAALEKSFDLKRGENTIVLDVSSLTSGIYYLSADSWGWHDGKTLVIEK